MLKTIVQNYEDGHKLREYTVDEKELKQGKMVTYTSKGDVLYEEYYKDNKLHGTHTMWLNGQIYSTGNYENGLEQGIFITYTDGYKNIVLTYDKGELCQPVLIYDTKGDDKGKLIWEWGMRKTKDDVFFTLHGKYIWWRANGSKFIEHNYVNGWRDGEHYQWYNNGQICVISNFFLNNLHGKILTWHKNGKPCLDADFEDNKLIKINFCLDENGQSCVLGSGTIEVYKIIPRLFGSLLITLEVPAESKRLTTINTKGSYYHSVYDDNSRIEYGIVKSIVNEKGKKYSSCELGNDKRNNSEPLHFKVGERIYAKEFNADIGDPDGDGITVKSHKENFGMWWEPQPSENYCIIS